MRLFALAMTLVQLTLPARGRADESRCTPALARAAEEATDLAHHSWADLHAQFIKYVKGPNCDDGAIAEGWSDAVGRLLADHWEQFQEFARLADADPSFHSFVLKHIDMTLPGDDLERIRTKARTACPQGHERVCRQIRRAIHAVDVEAKGAHG